MYTWDLNYFKQPTKQTIAFTIVECVYELKTHYLRVMGEVVYGLGIYMFIINFKIKIITK